MGEVETQKMKGHPSTIALAADAATDRTTADFEARMTVSAEPPTGAAAPVGDDGATFASRSSRSWRNGRCTATR
jgi:hypothetical protein